MSILIRGMKMPKNCFLCPLSVLSLGERLFCEVTKEEVLRSKIPSDCPLIELSEKHGDLIDRDELRKKKWAITWDDGKAEYYNAEDIEAAPAVIPAEEVKNNE